MEVVRKVFQIDSDIVKNARYLDNYLIEHDKKVNENKKICAVYFSSNYIYFPNEKKSFESSILIRNRFEWWNLRHPNAIKHIFIRDIYKQWYLHGINSKINSIEKLADFIRKEISGYKSIFIGSSSGGYAATLLGSILKVDKIYTFNNQFYLTDLLENSNSSIDPIVFREKNNISINKFYNIKPFLKYPKRIFYFYSNKSEWDVRQFNMVKDLNLNFISVNTKVHGIPFLKNNLIPLFSLKISEIEELKDTLINPLLFSIRLVGVKKTLNYLITLIPAAFKRWLYNPIISYINKM